MPGAATTRLENSRSRVIRPAIPDDLPAIAAIQQSSPEAAAWDPTGYDVVVAEAEGRVVGFLVTRTVTEGEREVLNLAVAPEYRRRGIGRSLLRSVLDGTVFLEVRESNGAALSFYNSLGFHELSRRPEYYENPLEGAIVLKFHSC
jgi:ribosomal-protein-alanine acetyltransferase